MNRNLGVMNNSACTAIGSALHDLATRRALFISETTQRALADLEAANFDLRQSSTGATADSRGGNRAVGRLLSNRARLP
jgi:hypothetical protein